MGAIERQEAAGLVQLELNGVLVGGKGGWIRRDDRGEGKCGERKCVKQWEIVRFKKEERAGGGGGAGGGGR